MADEVRVVGICGSLRKKSYTRLALKLALRGAEEAGAESHLIDRHDYQLVFCDGGDSGDDPPMNDGCDALEGGGSSGSEVRQPPQF
jgi:multimeric flavodoxin WrbA